MKVQLKSDVEVMFIHDSKLLNDAFAISNPVVQPLSKVLGWEAFNELNDAVNLAISQAAKDAFIAGIRFMQDPAKYILTDGEDS